jgi:hypothetical protein
VADLHEEAMTTDFKNRDQLYRSAVQALGEEEADPLMASLPPMDWSEIATKSDLDLKLDALEQKLTVAIETGLRKQSQWVFGSVAVMALSMLGVVISALALT